MSFARSFEKAFRRFLPSPLAIALLLTFFTIFLAFWLGDFPPGESRLTKMADAWQKGLWNPPLLVFMVQMMLILVLGHALALAPPISRFIDFLLSGLKQPAQATALVCFFTLLVAFFNWGLGLIFGAIMARKAAEKLSKRGFDFNYGLLGAAGYSGLMVWHGGISGSAPLKVVEKGHLKDMVSGVLPPAYWQSLPDRIGFEETVFSGMNLSASVLLLIALPSLIYLIAQKAPRHPHSFKAAESSATARAEHHGAEKIDHSSLVSRLVGAFIISVALLLIWQADGWNFMEPNFINLSLLGMNFLAHRNFNSFSKSVDKAVGGAAGILIQFPLYFGIMGLMNYTGLIHQLSNWFSTFASPTSFPFITFFSAGLINIFVPSGGGQWAIQGPVLIETAHDLNLPLAKCIMALAYGDQITNMLQPFWALPLLGITGLKAREILPYSLLLMLVGSLIFLLILSLF